MFVRILRSSWSSPSPSTTAAAVRNACDPVAGLAGALQEEGDPPERGRGREWCAQLLTFLACFLAAFFARFCALAARFWAFSKLFSVESAALRAARRAR